MDHLSLWLTEKDGAPQEPPGSGRPLKSTRNQQAFEGGVRITLVVHLVSCISSWIIIPSLQEESNKPYAYGYGAGLRSIRGSRINSNKSHLPQRILVSVSERSSQDIS